MNVLSEEQLLIVDSIKEGKNIIVDACAGSGKSTTVLSVASKYPHHKILLITYNHSLRKEMQEKVKELQIQNIQVHTYHSLAFTTYSKDAGRDKGMRQVITENISPIINIPHFDILVLDEVQDMTPLYFRFILKYIKDKREPFQLIVLGDYMQGLYEFKGADIRFLTKSSQLWSQIPFLKSPENCVDCSLRTSYRITNQIAAFVNQAMLGSERLHACRDGAPVLYIRGRIERLQEKVVNIIKKLLASGASPGDIFVLGGSVKGANSMVKKIENALVEGNIPCHVPMIENGEIDEKVIKGKVVFSTFHSCKGRQRPYVFVVGFDHSYFRVARELDPTVCPNTLYVACTRASKQLILLESYDLSTDRPLKFLKYSHKQMMQLPFMTFDGIAQDEFADETVFSNNSEIITHYITPTELTKFISESVLDNIREYLINIFIPISREPLSIIDLPTVIQTKSGFYEDVSDLNGIAIPIMFYDSIQTEYEEDPPCILYPLIRDQISRGSTRDYVFLRKCFKNTTPSCETIADYLYMANLFQASQEKLYFKLNQITKEEYNWLSPEILSQCKKRFIETFQEEIENEKPDMEHQLVHYSDEESNIMIDQILMQHFPTKQFRFSARVDLLTEKSLWELKCTSELSEEYLIQTLIYAWILRTIDPDNQKDVKLMNIKTGEILLLRAEKTVLDTIMVLLLESKYGKREHIPDVDFLDNCCSYL